MAYTYQELHHMKVTALREIAEGLGDERLEGNSQMNKEHLLPILCEVLGVETHAHHEVVGIDKASIKSRIRALKAERDKAIEAKDRAWTKQVRRQMHHLKRQLHKFTV